MIPPNDLFPGDIVTFDVQDGDGAVICLVVRTFEGRQFAVPNPGIDVITADTISCGHYPCVQQDFWQKVASTRG